MAIIRNETDKLRKEIAVLRERVMDLERDLMFAQFEKHEYRKQVVSLNAAIQRKVKKIKEMEAGNKLLEHIRNRQWEVFEYVDKQLKKARDDGDDKAIKIYSDVLNVLCFGISKECEN